MAELMDVREREGRYEILTTIDSVEGELWEPLATLLISSKLLERPDGVPTDVSLADALRREGWISPFEELPLCEAIAMRSSMPADHGDAFVSLRERLDHVDEHHAKGRSPVAALSITPDELRSLLDAVEFTPITREHALRAAQNAVRNQGYAVAVHGSQVKDLDLIAVPWQPTALDAQDVAELIAEAIPGVIEEGSPEKRPHGRLSFTIRPRSFFGFDRWWIDLAVFPRDCDWTVPNAE